LRSPHNVHMTVLARMGVPGVVLWASLIGCVAVSLLLGYLRARAADEQRTASVLLWILAYWSAFIVNASFDVCLEGPQGGIWFWSVTGLAVTALEQQRMAARHGRRSWSSA
jgi:O-antigen ligase